MEISKITELLTKKFSGVHTDGLAQLAASIALLIPDENIERHIESLSADDVNSFVGGWQKTTDTKVANAIKTHESRLRNKFNFVEKTAPNGDDPKKDETGNDNDIAKMIAAAVAESNKSLLAEIASLKNHNLSENRMKVVNSLFDDKIPAEFKNSIIGEFSSRTFANDDEFNTFVENKKTSIANFNQDLINRGLVDNPVPNYGKVDDNGVSEAVKQWAKARTDNESAGKKLF